MTSWNLQVATVSDEPATSIFRDSAILNVVEAGFSETLVTSCQPVPWGWKQYDRLKLCQIATGLLVATSWRQQYAWSAHENVRSDRCCEGLSTLQCSAFHVLKLLAGVRRSHSCYSDWCNACVLAGVSEQWSTNNLIRNEWNAPLFYFSSLLCLSLLWFIALSVSPYRFISPIKTLICKSDVSVVPTPKVTERRDRMDGIPGPWFKYGLQTACNYLVSLGKSRDNTSE
jgi:hypothetical protein